MDIVGVRLKISDRVHYFDPANLDLAVDDRVIVETDGGRQEGWVVIAPRQVIYSEVPGPLRPVLGRAEDPPAQSERSEEG